MQIQTFLEGYTLYFKRKTKIPVGQNHHKQFVLMAAAAIHLVVANILFYQAGSAGKQYTGCRCHFAWHQPIVLRFSKSTWSVLGDASILRTISGYITVF